jgi:hypothetical protein
VNVHPGDGRFPTSLLVHGDGDVATALPSYVIVIDAKAANPDPVAVTFTDVPTGPVPGVRVMAASVNVVVAVFVPSVAVTVYVPVIPSKA